MGFIREIERVLTIIFDAVLPHSPEAVIARSLSEETLKALLYPVTLVHDPWITVLFPYFNPKVRALIWAVKYRSEQGPLPALGHVAAPEILKVISAKKRVQDTVPALMVPMPSSPARIRSRGYNQAERIALAILPNLGSSVEYAPDVLGRENRESQVKVPRERRHRNVEGSFFVFRPEKVRGRHVLIVDDVVETGATVRDARAVLLKAGATNVTAVAMAH
jgi:ComF family protein